MGGKLTWVVREADGTVHRIAAWTNVFPGATMDEDLLRGDPAAFDRNVGPWLAEAGRVEAPLAPVGYGIVVTDFVTHTVVDCQAFTRMAGRFTWPEYLSPDVETDPALRERDSKGRPFDEGYRDLVRIHAEGRLLSHRVQETGETLDVAGLSLADVLRATLETTRSFRSPGMVTVAPPPPWRILTFTARDTDGVAAAREAVARIGLVTTTDDEAAWDAHLVEVGADAADV